MGRLLQGISAGLIGVTVPLYLAECLGASSRGKGTGIFQWLLTLGIVVAAVIGFYFSIKVEEVEKPHDAADPVIEERLAHRHFHLCLYRLLCHWARQALTACP
jgi:MFS family permease